MNKYFFQKLIIVASGAGVLLLFCWLAGTWIPAIAISLIVGLWTLVNGRLNKIKLEPVVYEDRTTCANCRKLLGEGERNFCAVCRSKN